MLRRVVNRAAEITGAATRRSLTSWLSRGSYSSGPSGETALYGLIGANAAVFATWSLFDNAFMVRHFTLSYPNLEAGRLHTVVTYAFSHVDILHMGTNLLALYFFGGALTRVLLGKQLMNLYLTGALCSAAADLTWKAIASQRQTKSWMDAVDWRDQYRRRLLRDRPSLGASGAVNAVTTLFCCTFPREMIYLYFFIPVPAFLLGVLFVLHDFSRLRTEDNVSHAGHLGGVAVGLISYLRLRYGRRF